MTRGSLALAIEALSWMEYTGIGERASLLKASKQMDITEKNDLKQAHKWIMEINRFRNRLDWTITQMQESDLKEASHGIRAFFRLIAYMRFIESRPNSELVRAIGWTRQLFGWQELRPYEESLAGLVNRSPPSLTAALSETEKLGLDTCHPSWYVERLMQAFGRDIALTILRRDLLPVSSFARINELKSKKETIEEQINAHPTAINRVYALEKIDKGDHRVELSASGEIVIQDLASIVAGMVAGPEPDQTVLDICAAPGNKTCHLAAQMQNSGEIYSVELSSSRLEQWKREMKRTGCTIASVVKADARLLPIGAHADVCLVDPPCSNSGVFARNPASKWRISSNRLAALAQAQRDILHAAGQRLSPGGTLVYCTCSILPEENELVIEDFLKKDPEFSLSPQSPFLGAPGMRGLDLCQRFYSHLHDCNGYFIAKLHRE